MAVNFSVVSKIFKIPMTSNKYSIDKMSTLAHDIVQLSGDKAKPVISIVSEIYGCLTKEDLEFIRKYKHQNLNSEEQQQIINNEILQELANCSVADKQSSRLIFNAQNLKSTAQKKIKSLYVKLLAIDQAQRPDKRMLTHTPMNVWYDTNLGVQNSLIENSIFNHPVDKALAIVGALVKEDYDKISKLEKSFSILEDSDIQKRKLNILTKFADVFSSPNSEFWGAFTIKEQNKFRQLIIEYTALNNIHKTRGIYTKGTERVIYASKIPQNCHEGDYINGLGLIVNKLEIKTNENKKIPAIITLSNNEGWNCFRMYDLNKLEELTKTKEPSVLEEESKSLIAEIRFVYLKKFNSFMVRNFINFNTQKYPKAGFTIGFNLMKLLCEKDCKPIRIKALAYGDSKHSPVNYYRRFGFTPITYSEQEIENIMKENNGTFPYDIPVELKLESFDNIKKRIALLEKVFSQ